MTQVHWVSLNRGVPEISGKVWSCVQVQCVCIIIMYVPAREPGDLQYFHHPSLGGLRVSACAVDLLQPPRVIRPPLSLATDY